MITEWNDLALILNAKDIQTILAGNGQAPAIEKVREMMNSKDFPLIKGYRELKVSRDAFREYLMFRKDN